MAVRHGVFGVVPLLGTAYLLFVFYVSPHLFASDFHRAYWPAAHRILDGQSPYIDPRLLTVANGFIYPAVGALLFAPVAFISNALGGVIFTLLNIAAGLLTLRVLNVRDFRLYGLVFFWLPVISAWETANVTLLLGLGVALAWRYRQRPATIGLLVAVLVSVKVFLWPLGIWLLATRRYKSMAYAAAYGVVLNVAAWTILGFNELPRYARLAKAFTKDGERVGYSVVALVLHVGATPAVAYATALALAGVSCVACVVSGRRGNDRAALVWCLAVTMLATPIIWLHYFALLMVPLALTRPRLSGAWALPLAMWVCLPTDSPATWKVAVALVACAAVFATALRARGGTARAANKAVATTPGPRLQRLARRPVGPPLS
jgi:alpha-1,2-mannosyltransferase